VKAEASLLLELEHGSQWEVFKTSLKNGYMLVLVSSLIVLLKILLHPLTSSCFFVKPGLTTKNPLTFSWKQLTRSG